MHLTKIIHEKVEKYKPRGGLDKTSQRYLYYAGLTHDSVIKPSARVALLSEAVALELKKDARLAFFGGLLHDFGKIFLPSDLFDKDEISQQEYDEIKTHVWEAYQKLRNTHLFVAIIAGLHHNVYKGGYGLSVSDLPKWMSPELVKKILDITTIVSVCDFIDAYSHRSSKIKDGSDKRTGQQQPTLKEMLESKYPNDKIIVESAIKNMHLINGNLSNK